METPYKKQLFSEVTCYSNRVARTQSLVRCSYRGTPTQDWGYENVLYAFNLALRTNSVYTFVVTDKQRILYVQFRSNMWAPLQQNITFKACLPCIFNVETAAVHRGFQPTGVAEEAGAEKQPTPLRSPYSAA